MGKRNYWLFKSEPTAYSFSDLMGEPNKTAEWDGVRNYQARNFLRDDILEGDGVLFYHSNITPPAIVGIATVVRSGYPDWTAWDQNSEHPDPKSTPDHPIWYMVDIKGEIELSNLVTLPEIKANPSLKEISLFTRPRVSVHPIAAKEWQIILDMSEKSG